MKPGQKKNNIAGKIVLSTIYFVIFSALVLLVGLMNERVFKNPTFSNVSVYIFVILITIVVLILFISAWEQIFESEDHPFG